MEQLTLTRRQRRFYKPKRPSTITVPAKAGPHVKLVFAEMRRQNITYETVEERSGVLRTTLKAWRHKNKPSLDSIEAILGVLGWDFVPVPRENALPAALVAELVPIAERFGLTMPGATEALIALVTSIHERFGSVETSPPTAPTLKDLTA